MSVESGLYKHSYKTARRQLTSLTVYNTGCQRCEPGNAWGPGVRDHFLIHHVVQGRGILIEDGRRHEVLAGQTFAVWPDQTVQYMADADDPWEYCWVGFQGTDARYLVDMTDFEPGSPVINIGDSARVQRLLMRIYDARGASDAATVRMTGALYSLLSFFMERARPARRGASDPGAAYVRRARDYIAGTFSGAVTVEEIAAAVGLCRSTLYRAFKEHGGQSPLEYLVNFRVRQACALLKKRELPIKAVAYSVGFSDPLYFSRVFKRVMGMPPLEYARQHPAETE